jgi:hypothetical protein
MAKKFFASGSTVDAYFIPLEKNENGAAQVATISCSGDLVSKTATFYIRFRELEFEASADVVSKITNRYQLNPAHDPRKIDLNIFESELISLVVNKGDTLSSVATNIVYVINNNIDLPFTATSNEGVVTLTSKFSDVTSKFELSIVDENGDIVTTANYGIAFTFAIDTDGAGNTDIQPGLDAIQEYLRVTRYVSQFNDTSTLDKLQTKLQNLRVPLVCQWAIAYTSKRFEAMTGDPTSVDIQKLIDFANGRRTDDANVIITGDYGELKALTYQQRNQLLKNGIANFEKKIDGGFRIGDLCVLYNPQGQKIPLYDRTITLLGNIGDDLNYEFNLSPNWASIIIVDENNVSSNPQARKISDIKASLDTRIRAWGDNAWIGSIDEAIENSIVEQDKVNPDRFNINPIFDLSSVGRIFDIVNQWGYFFQKQSN